jgi:D-sedoheptulose 7-phosphate isomerase
MSVGGGNLERGVSVNIVRALELAAERGMTVFGIVGRDGGYTKRLGHHVVVVPTVDERLVTPHTEAFHAVIWHCLVSHPRLQQRATKW